jgi:hypothetical protein
MNRRPHPVTFCAFAVAAVNLFGNRSESSRDEVTIIGRHGVVAGGCGSAICAEKRNREREGNCTFSSTLVLVVSGGSDDCVDVDTKNTRRNNILCIPVHHLAGARSRLWTGKNTASLGT